MAEARCCGLARVYEQQVLGSLFTRLDEAFPEFGWQRSGSGWVAPNQEKTGNLLGNLVAPLRCDHPWGFTSADFKATGWLAFVSGEAAPERAAALGAIQMLAEVAGIDAAVFETDLPSDEEAGICDRLRCQALVETFLAQAHRALMSEAGAAARSFLAEKLGLPESALGEPPLGVVPSGDEVFASLSEAGFSKDEIEASGLLHSDDWAGRVIVPWRDPWGSVATILGYGTGGDAGDRTIAMPPPLDGWGCEVAELPAFGLDSALGPDGSRREVLLVEDPLEAIGMRHHGVEGVAAIGGAGDAMTPARWLALAGWGIREVTLAPAKPSPKDADRPGRGIIAALDAARRAQYGPTVYVISPAQWSTGSGPGQFVRAEGIESFQATLAKRVHAHRYKADDILVRNKPDAKWTDAGLRRALDEAIAFASPTPVRERSADLDRFFWPAIIASTGFDREGIEAARACGAPSGSEFPSDLAGDCDAHERRLERWRGRRAVGLCQKTLPWLDEATGGLRGLAVLAAPPRAGASALALQIAIDAVRHDPQVCCLFVSLQMDRWSLLSRVKSRFAQLDWRHLVFGSAPDRGQGGRDACFGEEESERLRQAEGELKRWGGRVRAIDAGDAPCPSTGLVLAELARLKARTETARALVVVDNLQFWPADRGGPAREGDAGNDRRRLLDMRAICDADDGYAGLVLSAIRTRNPIGGAMWSAEPADILANPAGIGEVADLTLLLRPVDDNELADITFGETRTWGGKPPGAAEMNAERKVLANKGISYQRLSLVKGRDGATPGETGLVFHYRQSRFEEGPVSRRGRSAATGGTAAGTA